MTQKKNPSLCVLCAFNLLEQAKLSVYILVTVGLFR